MPEGLELETSLGGVVSALNINLSQGEYLELCRGFKESSDGYWSLGDFCCSWKKVFYQREKGFLGKRARPRKKSD